ncbi:hypothetical protein HOY82DRAFT_538904 [Tuber indicum]|nr:hypothetical protein HOY82DRAFT_538904 [Tuber indicum]
MSWEELDDYAQDISKEREEGRYRRNVRRGGDGEVEKEGDYGRRLEERRRVDSEKVIEEHEITVNLQGTRQREGGEEGSLPPHKPGIQDPVATVLPRRAQQSSAFRGSVKRRFPTMLEDDDENADGGTAKVPRKKKAQSTAIVDAVSILASVKAEGKEEKFGFLIQQLQKQADLRYPELELEREKLEIERERNRADQRRSEFMMLQMQASIRAVIGSQWERRGPHSNEEENENITDVEPSFNLSNLSK